MNNNQAKETDVRQEEITGKQYLFHSLPKEFQIMHNIQYIMEKKTQIDSSTVPSGLLNAYMWKAIGDGTKYGIALAMAIAASVIKIKLSPNGLGLFLVFAFYLPLLFWTIYHFYFYSKIRAQVVGRVTQKTYDVTAKMFYETFSAVSSSLIIAFLYIMYILEDIAMWLHHFILSMDSKDSDVFILFIWMKKYFIKLYNLMIDLLTPPPDNLLSNLLFNTYFSTGMMVVITIIFAILFEQSFYKRHRTEVEKELKEEEEMNGYALDVALNKLRESGQ